MGITQGQHRAASFKRTTKLALMKDQAITLLETIKLLLKIKQNISINTVCLNLALLQVKFNLISRPSTTKVNPVEARLNLPLPVSSSKCSRKGVRRNLTSKTNQMKNLPSKKPSNQMNKPITNHKISWTTTISLNLKFQICRHFTTIQLHLATTPSFQIIKTKFLSSKPMEIKI